jgi:hypothetical protein
MKALSPFVILTVGAALAVPASFLAACSDGNSNPAPTVFGDDAGDATSSIGPDATSDTGSSPDGNAPETSSSNPDGSGADAGDAGAGPETAAACTPVLTDAGCWTCPSATDGSVEFLNQCYGTGVRCIPFDNLAKLPGYDAGLPPLH